MKDRTFYIVLLSVAAVGLIATAALVIYTFVAYQNSSIITYIAKEIW